MKKLAILVGHYGRGTGASWQGRDEWALALADARALEERLIQEGRLGPLLFFIDQDTKDQGIAWTTPRQIAVKLRWLADVKPDAALELHYNSAEDEGAAGNELCYYQLGDLPVEIGEAMKSLPNKHRGIKYRDNLRILKTEICPIAIVEPAFIFEPQVGGPEFRAAVVEALHRGINAFYGEG